MKGIIMAIAIAAGMALGGAASGQTREEVNEIIRRAQQIRIADLNRCKANRQHLKIAKSISRVYFEEVMFGDHRVSPQQLIQAVCRYMNDMK